MLLTSSSRPVVMFVGAASFWTSQLGPRLLQLQSWDQLRLQPDRAASACVGVGLVLVTWAVAAVAVWDQPLPSRARIPGTAGNAALRRYHVAHSSKSCWVVGSASSSRGGLTEQHQQRGCQTR